MVQLNGMTLSPYGEKDILIERSFDAPQSILYSAHTDPDFVKQWMVGPDGWTMPVCRIDAQVGGTYRYEWANHKGQSMGAGGVFKEVIKNEKLVVTEKFDEPWYPGEAICTTTFKKQGEQTLMTVRLSYETKGTRDHVFSSNMENGLAASYNRLDKLLQVQ